MKYEPIEFSKLSEAIAYVEGGGKLYAKQDFSKGYSDDNIVDIYINDLVVYEMWCEPALCTKAKPTTWYEKLDGTVDNGVLCWTDSELDDVTIITAYKPGDYYEFKAAYNRGDDGLDGFDELTPLTREEIQKFMDNAPEES